MTTTFVEHCVTVYKALEERSTIKVVASEPDPVRVFSGRVSEAYNACNISQTYYGPIFKTLEDTGALLKIQRGGRGIDSVFVLRGLPDVWPNGLGWRGKNSEPLTEDSRYGTILLEVESIKDSIGGINVVTALSDFEQRLVKLEALVGGMLNAQKS